jgi:nitroreductase
METLVAIHSRRSVREYQNKPVPENLVKELLAAAMQAPSAGNARPWQFVVLTDRQLLERIPSLHPHAAMAARAALAVLVCADLKLEAYPGNWNSDCAAAIQNLLLAVHAKGLGAVWTGVHPDKGRIAAFQQLLGLPEHVVPLALVPIGYPLAPPPPEARYEAAKVHYNRW